MYFPDILRVNPLDSNEKYVSYDVDSLLISIPLGEIDFVLDQIFFRMELGPFVRNQFSKSCQICGANVVLSLADGRLIRQRFQSFFPIYFV